MCGDVEVIDGIEYHTQCGKAMTLTNLFIRFFEAGMFYLFIVAVVVILLLVVIEFIKSKQKKKKPDFKTKSLFLSMLKSFVLASIIWFFISASMGYGGRLLFDYMNIDSTSDSIILLILFFLIAVSSLPILAMFRFSLQKESS